MRVLVTGGAGYVGSHTVRELIDAGHRVVVLDNLSHGHKQAIDPRAQFIDGSTWDFDLLCQKMKSHHIDAVIHFAADSEVGESVLNPYKYYQNNFVNSLTLLNAMICSKVNKLVFSSTAAVYGSHESLSIEEDHPRDPTNPYGRSKMMMEMAIEDFSRAYGIDYTILRYFNVAGANPDSTIGEDHRPECHLIPRILQAALDGGEVKIFGTDHSTPDGTCVRDYVHVVDLARAHVLAVNEVNNGEGKIYNVGSERGFSVREVITACEKVTGKKIRVSEVKARPGDCPVLVASSRKIREELKWEPLYPSMDSIVQHAWKWHSTHPKGYGEVEKTRITLANGSSEEFFLSE